MGATGFGGGNEKKTVGEEHGDHGVRWEKFLPQVYSKVLLVESDDSTRQIIAALLRKCGYRVSAVADGLKAWETLKEHPQNVDLVLTEVELPSMSGYSLLSMVMEHKTFKNIPVIVMSSKDSVDMAFKCLLKGASDFLFKPIRKNELQNLWQHVWRKRLSDEDKVPGLYQKQEAADNTTNASRDPQDKSITPLENCQPDCVSSSAGSDLREPVSDASCTSEFAGLDLLRTMDNHPPCSAYQPEALIDAKNEDVKFLELSLESHALKVLNHSSFSAFSTYNRRHSSPARGQCTVSNASLASSVTSQGGGVCDPVLISHREEALKKYRLKRKDRCFEKAKNLSRSTHAEKQPRVKELTNHG